MTPEDVAERTLAGSFRNAMRRLATTIALVTTGREGAWAGMAATAVTSVSAEPPTVLVAVNRSASMMPALMSEGAFCINLLASRHSGLVAVFSGARKGMDRFQSGIWRPSDGGLPILTDAVSSLICKTITTLDVETHCLLIGSVTSVINHPTIDPLLWVDGSFASAETFAANDSLGGK